MWLNIKIQSSLDLNFSTLTREIYIGQTVQLIKACVRIMAQQRQALTWQQSFPQVSVSQGVLQQHGRRLNPRPVNYATLVFSYNLSTEFSHHHNLVAEILPSKIYTPNYTIFRISTNEYHNNRFLKQTFQRSLLY